jgi:predicted metal-binding protein
LAGERKIPTLSVAVRVWRGLSIPAPERNREIDVIHLGTCVKLAMETAACPIEVEHLIPVLEHRFGVEVVLGTHSC